MWIFETTDPGMWIFMFVLAVFVGICCCFLRNPVYTGSQPAALAERQVLREQLQGHNGPGLGRVHWNGIYSENGETKPTEYLWVADAAGHFAGTSTDDDGAAQVSGTLCLPSGASSGQIAWREERPGVLIEAYGRIMTVHGFLGCQPTFTLEANYLSDNGTGGSVQLRSIEAQVGVVQASAVAVVSETRWDDLMPEEVRPLRNYAQ